MKGKGNDEPDPSDEDSEKDVQDAGACRDGEIRSPHDGAYDPKAEPLRGAIFAVVVHGVRVAQLYDHWRDASGEQKEQQMAVSQLWTSPPQFVDASGDPYSGAKLFFYAAGSSTKQNTYTDSTGNTACDNPITLNSSGYPAVSGSVVTPFGTIGQSYKIGLAIPGSSDPPSSFIWSVDNVEPINDTTTSVDQWVTSGLTPTYVSATQFTLSGDQTTAFHVGRKVKTTNTGGTVISVIVTSSHAAGTTTVTVENDAGTIDSGLSAVSYALISGTNDSVPHISAATHSKFSADAVGPTISLRKSRGVGGYTVVQSGDDLGSITAYGSDGTDFEPSGQILFEVDTAPGAGDMPGRIVFSTTADAAEALTEALRIDSSQRVSAGGAAVAGEGGTTPKWQFNGIGDTGANRTFGLHGWSTNGQGPWLNFACSRAETPGSHTVVQDGSNLGRIGFFGSDGTDFAQGAEIKVAVDGSPGNNDMPGRIIFSTTADASAAVTERLRINQKGNVIIGNGTTTTNANATGPNLTVDAIGNDDEAITLRDTTDVATGYTALTDTATWATLKKLGASVGGLHVEGYAETTSARGLQLTGYSGAADTTPSTSALATVMVYGYNASGTDKANAAANQLVFGVGSQVGGADRSLFFVDEDGDFFADGSAGAAFDDFDDIELLMALEEERAPTKFKASRHRKGRYGKADVRAAKLISEPTNGSPMVNYAQVMRLHSGVVRQLYDMIEDLRAEVAALKTK